MTIKPVKALMGDIAVPGDKSISHRALMIGAIANGETRVKNLLDCDDCNYTMRAFVDMGIDIKKGRDGVVTIQGKGLKGLKRPRGEIYVGESGTTMRLLAGILAGQEFEATLTGGKSLSGRPMLRIVEPLKMMGADIAASGGGVAPLRIRGSRLKAIDYEMKIASAQVKSAVLLAGLYADGLTSVTDPSGSRDHTERMLKFFGAEVAAKGTRVSIRGNPELAARDLEIPGDISSAAYFIVGATMLAGSGITIRSVGVNPTRAGIIDVLGRMGADVKVTNRREVFEPAGDIEVSSRRTRGVAIDAGEIPRLVDEIPILMVLASVSQGTTTIRGAKELRVKETDRIDSMARNLREMGADIRVSGDTIAIDGVACLRGAGLSAFDDHRTAMSLAIAALAARGESVLDNAGCISKSFPEFFNILSKITLTK